MSKLLKFVIGFITGALAGGIAALLLAPKTGFELRRDIQTDVEGWIKEAESTISGNYILLETPSKSEVGE
jgi:gas vesicle protein